MKIYLSVWNDLSSKLQTLNLQTSPAIEYIWNLYWHLSNLHCVVVVWSGNLCMWRCRWCACSYATVVVILLIITVFIIISTSYYTLSMLHCIYCTRPWALCALGSHAVKYAICYWEHVVSDLLQISHPKNARDFWIEKPLCSSQSLFYSVPAKWPPFT